MDANELGTARWFDASGEQIYGAFEDPQRLARWWGPDGFSNTFHVFEFKPGGAWTFTMHSAQGANYPNESRFVELIPGRRVVIDHVCAPLFTLSIELTPAGGGTNLTWRQRFKTAEDCARLRALVVPANEQNLDRLAAELQVRSGPIV